VTGVPAKTGRPAGHALSVEVCPEPGEESR
jgi:hypothetical protein